MPPPPPPPCTAVVARRHTPLAARFRTSCFATVSPQTQPSRGTEGTPCIRISAAYSSHRPVGGTGCGLQARTDVSVSCTAAGAPPIKRGRTGNRPGSPTVWCSAKPMVVRVLDGDGGSTAVIPTVSVNSRSSPPRFPIPARLPWPLGTHPAAAAVLAAVVAVVAASVPAIITVPVSAS